MVAMGLVAALAAAVAGVSLACTRDESASQTSQTSVTVGIPAESSRLAELPPAPPPPTVMSPAEQAALAETVSIAVNDVVPGAEIGLLVYDRHTNTIITSAHPDEQFYTASVVKLPIVISVLHDAGWKLPTGSDRADLVAMLSRSADWVAATVWQDHGGPAIIERVTALAGLTHTSPPRNPHQWEMTRTSPRDVLAVYEYINNEIPPHAREFILTALTGSTGLAADGFDQFFGIPGALPGTPWAIKQGWMRINNGLVLNTTGLVGTDRRYVVVLLTQQPGGTTFEGARAAVTAGITALAPTLTVSPTVRSDP